MHAVIDPAVTNVADALCGLVPDDATLVVLSARDRIEAWGDVTAWFHGGSIDTLCSRFKRYRKAQPERKRWVVVVDMLDVPPVSKGYNQLFKTKAITVVAVSSVPSVLKDYRFARRVEADYAELAPPPAAATTPPASSSSSWFW